MSTSEQALPPMQPEQVKEEGGIGPFTREQLDGARLAYAGLQKILNLGGSGSSEQHQAVPAQVQNTEHRTFADVADKTLDALSHGVAQIAATTEKAAPQVWKIMVVQQIANAISNIIGPIAALLATYLFHIVIYRAYGNPTNPDLIEWRDGLSTIIPILVAAGCTIWLIVSLMGTIQKLINPAYFAVRDLVELITGRSNTQ